MEAISKFLNSTRAVWFVLLLATATHLPFMNEPPRSIHVWRQTLTLGMARNLYEEGMNPLEPKVDCRYETNGITGSHFLTYEWGLAALYKVFGLDESTHRWYSLMWYLVAILAFYYLLLEIHALPIFAFAGAWMFAFSPELYYQAINAMPDILALAMALSGLLFYVRLRKTGSFMLLFFSLGCLLIAGLTKLQYMAFAVPIAVLSMQDFRTKKISGTLFTCLVIGGACISTTALMWYAYAAELIKQTGLDDVGLKLNVAPSLQRAFDILTQNIISDFPELLAGFASAFLIIAGLVYYLRKKPTHYLLWPLLVWTLILITYHILVLAQMGVHQYYMIPYLPILFIVGAYGFIRIYSNFKTIALILLLLAPVLAMVRIIPARWSAGNEGVLMSFYNSHTRDSITRLIPEHARVINGPDASNCINFYFTHTKGFGYRFEGDVLKTNNAGKRIVDDYINRGAQFLIITNEKDYNDARLKSYIDSVLFKNDELMVARIRR